MKNKLIIAALLFVPMSAYAGGFPDPFEASNTAKDAYQWSQQAIGDSAAAKGIAQKDSLAEQVLQTTVNTEFTNAKGYTNQAVNGILGEANSNAAVSIKAADSEQDAEVNKSLAQAQTDANGALSSALSSSANGDASTLASASSLNANVGVSGGSAKRFCVERSRLLGRMWLMGVLENCGPVICWMLLKENCHEN